MLLWSFVVGAQQSIHLSVKWPDTEDGKIVRKNCQIPAVFPDTLTLYSAVKDLMLQCNEKSYLNAAIAWRVINNDSIEITIDLGNSYRWIKLKKGNVPLDILSGAGYREQQFTGKVFNPLAFSQKVERMLQYLENNGYPFASIQLDSIEVDSFGIMAAINLQPHEFISFDTMEIRGNAEIKKWFLYQYLGVKPGTNYNEANFAQINSRLSQLPYLTVAQPTSAYFFTTKVMPVLFLDNKKSSSLDGIIGFAPNTQSGSTNNRLLITGEANLKLQNITGSGKSVDLNYRSFLGNSQDLHFKFVFPYIFRSNIAFDYDLSLIKQDTSFLDVRNEFGFQYRFIGSDYFKVFYQIQSTTLIAIDTNQIKASRSLPSASDLRNNIYGLGIKLTRYDYFLNPRKGFSIDLNGGVIIKEIIKNPTIDNIRLINSDGSTSGVYDTLQLKYLQYKVQGNMDYFIPIFKRATCRIQLIGGHILGDNLFVNELFRIGGIRSLKGFDEQAIFASTYAILNTELRYLLQQNSNIILFWNGAYYENSVKRPTQNDTPFGFGAGFNSETPAGVFSIFYAVGKEQNVPLSLSKAKVHFGFVNYF